MGSNRLPFGLVSGRQQASRGYSCTGQYEWQQLALRQREHETREQLHRGATLDYHLCTLSSDGIEDSMTATKISHRPRSNYDLHRCGAETVNNGSYSSSLREPETRCRVAFLHGDSEKRFDKWSPHLDRPGLLEFKQSRHSTSPICGAKRTRKYSAFYNHEHPSEITCPENRIGGPCPLSSCSCCYPYRNKIGAYHGQGHAYLGHSSKRARRSISPGPAPTSYWIERSPSFDPIYDYAKGADGQMHSAVSFGKVPLFNGGSRAQNRHYQENRYMTTDVADFPGAHFSEIDEAKYRPCIDKFRTYNKHEVHSSECLHLNISDCTSAGRMRHRDEVGRAHVKKPFDEFCSVHHEQLELSPRETFLDHLGSRRNCRNAYTDKMLRRKCSRPGFQKTTTNGGRVSRYGRNSRWKRYADQLVGQKARKNVACEDQSKGFCYGNGQDQQPHGEVHHGHSDVMRNDSREGNAETTMKVVQNGAKGNCHPQKNVRIAAACGGSTKFDENSNVFSPKYSNKTTASLNGPEQSEGSINMQTQSNKQPSVIDCTKRPQNMRTEKVSRGNPRHPQLSHPEKDVHPNESDKVSPSEVMRDCLNLWRRLKKDNGAEPDKVKQTDLKQTLKKTSVSIGGRERNGRTACGSSKRDDENDMASKSPKQLHVGRAKIKSEKVFQCPSGSNCNRSLQNTLTEQGLTCDLEPQPKANPGGIAQQKALSDARIETSWNGDSDTSKVEQDDLKWDKLTNSVLAVPRKCQQAVAAHSHSSVHEKASQHEAIHDHFSARRENKLDISCEAKKRAEGNGAKQVEQKASWSTGSMQLDGETVACCSKQDSLKTNASESSNQDSGTICSFKGPKWDKGTASKCSKEPINWTSGSDCRDNPLENKDCNVLRNKQEFSALADTENNMHQKETKEGYQPPQALEVTPIQQIPHQSGPDRPNSGVARQGDWTSRSSIPDLNSLPSMVTNEEFNTSKQAVYQVTGDGSKPQNAGLSAPFGGPAAQGERFRQPEPNGGLVRGICERETPEGANHMYITNSHSGPPQLNTVEENSTSVNAFKCALSEFIKNMLKPLWEEGLLTREVHKIIVRKAVEKVTIVLGPKIPVTELGRCRYLSDESQNLEKLVQGYLEVYVGREVLKSSTLPDNF